MQSFRPYVWIKKNSSMYNAFYAVVIPNDFAPVGLQSPADSTATSTRTYAFYIQSSSGTSGTTVDSNVGNHSQPGGITLLEIDVIDITDPSNPVKKGVHVSAYQNADTM